jgi:methionyl-tRNA formyltransferase
MSQETALTLERKSQIFIESLYKNIINMVEDNGLLRTVPNEGGQYISRTEMENMKEIVEGDDIDKKIRAFWFPPYTGAYIKINGKKYTLINEFILQSLLK